MRRDACHAVLEASRTSSPMASAMASYALMPRCNQKVLPISVLDCSSWPLPLHKSAHFCMHVTCQVATSQRVSHNLQLYLCDEDLYLQYKYTIAIHDAYEPTDHDHP